MGKLSRRMRRAFYALTGYDGAEASKRRRLPATKLVSEDDALPPGDRKKLISTTHDLRRNFAIAGWAIRKHLDYVASFTFQSKTGNTALDARIEELLKWWSRPVNCHVEQRHPLARMVRILEECTVVDGDIFVLKMDTGKLQPIEGDRIRTPQLGTPPGVRREDFVHGIERYADGRNKSYIVCKRDKRGGGGFTFERIIRAGHLVQHGYFDRFDQIRGISPLSAAINAYRDLYEGMDYALAQMKIAQLFGLTFYREAAESITTEDDEIEGEETEGETRRIYDVDFGKGPVILDMEPGDRAEFLENKTPSTEFREFTNTAIGAALKALDLPFSFYDESFTNYSGSRQALLQYEQSASKKRENLQILLNNLTAWRLGLFILDGELKLPAGMRLGDLKWVWIPIGIPWIDPLKEVRADVQAVNAGLASRTRILRRRGQDFDEVVEELAREKELLQGAGLMPADGSAGTEAVSASAQSIAEEVVWALEDGSGGVKR